MTDASDRAREVLCRERCASFGDAPCFELFPADWQVGKADCDCAELAPAVAAAIATAHAAGRAEGMEEAAGVAEQVAAPTGVTRCEYDQAAHDAAAAIRARITTPAGGESHGDEHR